MTVEDQIIRIPDAYAKAPDSVIYRILQLDAADRDEMRAALDRVRAWRSLDDAEGAALDMIGRDLGLPRGRMSDIEYRRRLQLRVATILSSGEIERFNEVLDALMGRAFIALQEGWTDVPVWDYHFDGSLRFDAEVQVFDAGDPCPLGPPEPAAVIVRCDLDALYEDIQAAFDRAGTSYRAEDILASIADLVAAAAELAAGGVRVKWFPIFPLQAALDAISVVQVAHPHLTLGTVRSHLYDGSYAFDGSTSFDGGYTALRAEHEETLAVEHQILTAPEHRFEGLARFNGREISDASREIAVHDPRLVIQAAGATAVTVEQAAAATDTLGPTMPRFTGSLLFAGDRRFDGYTALRAEHGTVESVEHQAACGPVSRFDMSLPFAGGLGFNGLRGLVVHGVTITEVTA